MANRSSPLIATCSAQELSCLAAQQHVTGKDKDGKELDAGGTWTAAYVKGGGKMKVRMLTAVPKMEPAK